MKDRPDLCFVDVETGGLDSGTADILEIAAYRMRHLQVEDGYDPGLFCVDAMHRYVRPRKPVHPDAAKINGYHPDLWASRGAVYVEDVLPEFDRFIVNATPAGQNPAFDMRFIQAGYEEANRDMPAYDYHLIDVAGLVWPLVIGGILPGQSLRHSCQFFGLGEQVHSAKDDLDKTVEVYIQVMRLFVYAARERFLR